MNFAFTEEQEFIREAARSFLADRAGPEALRQALASPAGWQEALWPRLAELGWIGAMVPESLGGSGLGAVELALILEETGQRLTALPFFETAVLGVQALRLQGSRAQQEEWLPQLASGALRVACAMSDAEGRIAPAGDVARLTRIASGYRLDGELHYVSFGHLADRLLVLACDPEREEGEALSLLLLPKNLPGLRIEPQTSLDLTRPYSCLRFDGVPVPADAVLGEPGTAAIAVERLLAIASGLLAADQAGGAAFCLSSTVEYAQQRVQFGRAIGSFQAVKHQLADMALRVEASRSAAYYAAAAIAENGAELEEACSVARAYCSEAYFRCAADAIQLHGGVGFTWEHHAHLYFKRARASMNWLGTPAEHRERIARHIGLDAAAETPT
jgi:alkylation response protein AidB-like acyl-CoA dehydrogenase